VRQGVRCVALALISAAAVSLAAQSASAGLLDGGWGGCGCGAPAYSYVETYAAPIPYVVEQRTVVRRTYMVAPVAYGYAEPVVGYGGWGWRHSHYRHVGWRHHY
jgi:hypothetical protein